MMDRQPLDDGGWFAPQRAERFEEATRWNGSNHISCATGTQWDHEEIYRTAKGAWVLHQWSQWQGSCPSWHRIDAQDACARLVRNGHGGEAERFFPQALAEAEA